MLGGRTGQRGTREPRESLCPSAAPGRVAPVTVLPRAACCMYGAAGTRGPRAQWEERGLVQRRRVCHGLRWGRRSGSGLLMAASSRSGPSLDAPAHTARARVHAAGTDVHAQLHMCACPNRPSCNLGWASGLSNIDSGPAPCRGSTSGRAQPGPSSWSSPGTATDSGTRPPGPASAAPPECLAPTPRLSPHTAVFFPPDKITLWIVVACYLFMVDLQAIPPTQLPRKTFQSRGTVSASFIPEFLAPGTGPGTDRVLRLF